MTDLLDALCSKLGTTMHRGRAFADCPFCGAPGYTRGGRPAYHFYLYDLERGRGACCWACGYKASLSALAAALEVQGTDDRPARALPEPPVTPWQAPDALERYTRAMQARWASVVAAWQAYKPLSEATIRREHLGLGKLPLYDEGRRRWYERRRPRLLYPLVEGGCMVGIAGRALPGDDGPKWITASYSRLILHGLEDVRPGDDLIWVENRVDRLLVQEEGGKALASGGLSWQPAWLDILADRRPHGVLLWFDHDLAGNGSPYHHAEMLARWRRSIEERRRDNPQLAARPFPREPEPRGPKLAAELHARRIHAQLYQWPRGSAFGADVGSLIVAERQQAVACD
jgi:hypothetical protein